MRTSAKIQLAWWAWVVQIFDPLMTYSSPSKPRCGLEAGKVGPAAGFGITLAPVIIARQDAGQEPRLLFGRAECADHRADQPQAKDGERGCAGQRAFLFKDEFLRRAPASAAVFLGPMRGDPALAKQDAVPFHPDIRLDKHARGAARTIAQPVGQIVLEERRALLRGRRYPRPRNPCPCQSNPTLRSPKRPVRRRLSWPSGSCAAAGHNRHRNSTRTFLCAGRNRPCRAGHNGPGNGPTHCKRSARRRYPSYKG